MTPFLLIIGFIFQNEVIKPTIDGFLSLIRSCAKAKTVKRIVFTSSAGTVNVEEHQKSVYDETDYSDMDFIYSKKMTGWVSYYFIYLFFKYLTYRKKENHIMLIFSWIFFCRCILYPKFWRRKLRWKQLKRTILVSLALYQH